MNTSLESDTLAIFQRHRRAVYGWAYRLLGHHHDAMDVTQEVFVKLFDQMQVVPPDNASAWLRRVTVNKSIDLIRSDRPELSADLSGMEAASGDEDRPSQNELRRDIAGAMVNLSDQQRSVLIAKVYDCMTFREIAGELDLAVPTVKTHYLRALSAVRDRLARRWDFKGSEP